MGRTVLVIDDELPIREAIVDILETVDIGCIEAGSGEDGIEIYQDRQAEIGLVILDLSMPKMSGEETLHKLREIDDNVRVIISSGFGRHEITANYAVTDAVDFLQKPYRLQELINIVETNLG